MRTLIIVALLLSACSTKVKTIGSIERLDPEIDNLVSSTASIEILAEGFDWSEGPVWVDKENMLLFSDVPKNIIHKWTEKNGTEVYLTPSGFTGESTASREPGSNGLILHNDSLILCQHGNRQMAKMNASLADPKPEFITLANTYNGKRFSSPNDAVYRSNGDLFFTDPPYGLPKQSDDDPDKEQPHNGVYKVTPAGVVSLLVDSVTRPNGIILMPGEKRLIVANSDPAKATWYEFEISENDSLTHARIFYDATPHLKTDNGLPDGLKVDQNGNIFASGPGGIWIFDSGGKVLGRLKIPALASNCALSPDEKSLYITADMYLLRVKMRD